jgi:hypothetical protein
MLFAIRQASSQSQAQPQGVGLLQVVANKKRNSAKKKESKILQNEATKPFRINKTVPKIGKNEAKRSQTSVGRWRADLLLQVFLNQHDPGDAPQKGRTLKANHKATGGVCGADSRLR